MIPIAGQAKPAHGRGARARLCRPADTRDLVPLSFLGPSTAQPYFLWDKSTTRFNARLPPAPHSSVACVLYSYTMHFLTHSHRIAFPLVLFFFSFSCSRDLLFCPIRSPVFGTVSAPPLLRLSHSSVSHCPRFLCDLPLCQCLALEFPHLLV
jgi:hypothetical protein